MPYLWKKGGVFIGGEPGLPRLGDWAGLHPSNRCPTNLSARLNRHRNWR